MAISYSEFSTYLDCSKKWLYKYKFRLRQEDSVHQAFGKMAHDVMRTEIIPEENLYPELKETFGISSWKQYFSDIFSEKKRMLSNYTQIHSELRLPLDDIVVVIDAIFVHNVTKRTLILDYKFTVSPKSFEDLLVDAQLPWYACIYALSTTPKLQLADIDVGYLSIPKSMVDAPRVLKNGTLSKDKSQNTTYDLYLAKINELGLDVESYDDILNSLRLKNPFSFVVLNVDENMVWRIFETVRRVQVQMKQEVILEQFSNRCKTCEYVAYCKLGKPIPRRTT